MMAIRRDFSAGRIGPHVRGPTKDDRAKGLEWTQVFDLPPEQKVENLARKRNAVGKGSGGDPVAHALDRKFPTHKPVRKQRARQYDGEMPDANETCWTLIEDAAAGKSDGQARFARHYAPVVKAYLLARWGRADSGRHLDDAMQDVFLECFKNGGALDRVESRRSGGFRAFLYGVTRNVTRRFEEKSGRSKEVTFGSTLKESPQLAEEDLERAFDRAWARSIVKQSVEVQRRKAAEEGAEAKKRVELLRLRFQEARPIREIAVEWDVDAAALHHDYARARREFEAALKEVVAFHLPGAPADVAQECHQLLSLLEE